MSKHSIHSIRLLAVLITVLGGSAFGYSPVDDPALIGWWTCDEGQGAVVADSSANGNDGTFVNGDPVWVEGAHGMAVELTIPTLVEIPAMGLTLEQATMAGWVKPYGAQPDWASVMMHREGSAHGFNILADNRLAYHWNDDAASWDYRGEAYIVDNEWTFAAVTVEPDQATFYVNGAEASVNVASHASATWDGNVYLGGDGTDGQAARRMTGALDDVSFFSRALAAEEIEAIMFGLGDPAVASAPDPADEATDVPRDVTLAWTPGESAVSHDVYFGASAEEVSLVSQGQAATTFDAGVLEFGQTYYWRVDEVAGDGTIVQGDVWSFTAEPFAYPITGVVATTNGAIGPDAGPENTVNGSGLNADDNHSTMPEDMWLTSAPADGSLYIQYEFDRIYKLNEMLVWNYNVQFEMLLGFGVKDVTVEYSVDGADWAVLGDVELAQGISTANYAANTAVDFAGVAARYVRLTVNSGYGMLGQFGLSEVRFLYIPAHAREPQPADGATGVDPDAVLGWRSGREAVSHEVHLGTDAAELDLIDMVSESSVTSTDIEFGQTYYWQVVEVNEAEAVSSWASDVWSFSTQEYALIDGFETYNDDVEAATTIFDAWLDGWVSDNGSTVGYFNAPFAEKAIVHSGSQSMPLEYNNADSPWYSEAERTFETAQNWMVNGADTLVLYVHGQAPAFVETDSGIIMNAIGADIWGTADEFRFAYKNLSGNGSIVARVDGVIQSNGWAKACVMVRESLDPDSAHALVGVTPVNGVAFQHRPATGAESLNVNQTGFAAPYWVKLTRTGNALTAERSEDGVNWVSITDDVAASTVEIPMGTNVLIGLALTSHDAAIATGAEYSNVATTGNVTGQWQVAEVGVAQPDEGNSAESLYVAIEDATGSVKVVANPDAAATARPGWQEWKIPFSELAGVNLSKVKAMYIGVGDRDNPSAGGSGLIFIDDIGYGRPAVQ